MWINLIDFLIAHLVRIRLTASQNIQARKKRDGMPIMDVEREAEILNRYERRQLGASAVARSILTLCRNGN